MTTSTKLEWLETMGKTKDFPISNSSDLTEQLLSLNYSYHLTSSTPPPMHNYTSSRQNNSPAAIVRTAGFLVVGTLLIQAVLIGAAMLFQHDGSIKEATPKPVTKRDSSTKGKLTPLDGVAASVSGEALRGFRSLPSDLHGASDQPEKANRIAPTTAERNAQINPLSEPPAEPKAPSNEKTTETSQAAPHAPSTAITEYEIKPGDTLLTIWEHHNAPRNDALAIADVFKKHKVPLNSLQVGSAIELEIRKDGNTTEIRQFKVALPDGRTFSIEGNSTDGYKGKLVEAKIVEAQKTSTGVIKSSIAEAAAATNIPYELVDEMVDAFGSRVKFRKDLKPGDSFTMIYTDRQLPDGSSLSPGPLKAASIVNNGKVLMAIRYIDKQGKEHVYDEKGEPLGEYFLRYPVKFSRVSSVFSTSRFHPVHKVYRPHNGVDFAAPTGTPVRAVADGVVVTKSFDRASGNMIKLKHCSTYSSAYLHLSGFAKSMFNGKRVTRGEVIGYVGMTGSATGPHLHFSLYKHGKYVDPMKVDLPRMPAFSDPLSKAYLSSMLKELKTAQANSLKLTLAANQSINHQVG